MAAAIAGKAGTALIVGSTGNIGVSAVIGALRANLSVLAIVRNSDSAEKLFRHVGTREGITTVEADITDENGVKNVVEQVKAGKLPAFQHVYAVAGGALSKVPLHEVSLEEFRRTMKINFETNFYAYRATIPYLLTQNTAGQSSTWTLCTGGLGDAGLFAATSMSQGVMFSMASAASQDLKDTNVRFNEVYLNLRVEVDEQAEKSGGASLKASVFAENYHAILKAASLEGDMKGKRVIVETEEEITKLNIVDKGKRWKSPGSS